MSDEEIIKKRLIIDGDGTGDDRRLNMLIKQFLKWTSAKYESPETNQMLHDRILAQLAQCQFAAIKSDLTYQMIDQEIQNYGTLSEQIEKSIELAKQEIEESKKELTLAKEIRKNKMEYDLLAKIIKQEPDREETTKQIETLRKELEDLTEKSIKLDRKLDKRRKDLSLLMYAVRELEAQAEESSDDEDMKADTEEITTQRIVAKGSDDESSSTSQSTRKRKGEPVEKDLKKSTPDDEAKEAISVDEELLELSLDKEDEEEKALAS